MTVFVSMPLILNLTVDAIEALKWELLLLYQPINNSLLAYLCEMVEYWTEIGCEFGAVQKPPPRFSDLAGQVRNRQHNKVTSKSPH